MVNVLASNFEIFQLELQTLDGVCNNVIKIEFNVLSLEVGFLTARCHCSVLLGDR